MKLRQSDPLTMFTFAMLYVGTVVWTVVVAVVWRLSR
jgi:hypothetical protein